LQPSILLNLSLFAARVHADGIRRSCFLFDLGRLALVLISGISCVTTVSFAGSARAAVAVPITFSTPAPTSFATGNAPGLLAVVELVSTAVGVSPCPIQALALFLPVSTLAVVVAEMAWRWAPFETPVSVISIPAIAISVRQ
jgi:hypothetical protein